jgi:hypothetical protein
MALAKGAKATTEAYHAGSLVWVPESIPSSPRTGKRYAHRWAKGRVCKVVLAAGGKDKPTLEVELEDGSIATFALSDCPLQNERDDTVDDLVKSDFLHEPGCVA